MYGTLRKFGYPAEMGGAPPPMSVETTMEAEVEEETEVAICMGQNGSPSHCPSPYPCCTHDWTGCNMVTLPGPRAESTNQD